VSTYWTLATMLARLRQLIAQPATYQISDAELTNRLNDFYQSRLPIRLHPDELSSTYRFMTVGAYQIAMGDGTTKNVAGMLRTIPGVCGVGFSDSVETFESQEDGSLMGTLGGTGRVDYTSGIYQLNFATAPQMNAQIGVYYDSYTLPDSVLTVSAPLACAGYPVSLVEDVEMFWSHWPMYQPYYIGGAAPPLYQPNIPQEALNYDGRLTVRPVPDQAYMFKCASLEKPVALSVNVGPLRDIWGPYIVIETAFEYLSQAGDEELAIDLKDDREQTFSDAMQGKISQMINRRAKGCW
jgi:hypothetical protein